MELEKIDEWFITIYIKGKRIMRLFRRKWKKGLFEKKKEQIWSDLHEVDRLIEKTSKQTMPKEVIDWYDTLIQEKYEIINKNLNFGSKLHEVDKITK